MATETPHPVELGAEMDYPQHERTYSLFLAIAKYGALHIVALLIAMAVGFFTSAGFFTAFVLFIILSAIGYVLLH